MLCLTKNMHRLAMLLRSIATVAHSILAMLCCRTSGTGFTYSSTAVCLMEPRMLYLATVVCVQYGLVFNGRPGSSEVPRNPLTRWDVSSIPANGIFLTKKLTKKQN